jgi:hypothetical protein
MAMNIAHHIIEQIKEEDDLMEDLQRFFPSLTPTMPNNSQFADEFIGAVDKKDVFVQIGKVYYHGILHSIDRRTRLSKVWIDGVLYSFIHPGDKEDIILKKVK